MLSTTSSNGEILPLTSLRFFAAVHIVLFHVWTVFLPSQGRPGIWSDFVNLGYTGVSIFFVLSGYILTLVYMKRQGQTTLAARPFWIARFARIYPLYATSLLVFLPFEVANLGHHGVIYKSFKLFGLALSNFSMIQAWYPALAGGWNRPCWSVSVEAFFYAAYPLVGSWVWCRAKRPLQLGAAVWAVSVLVSLIVAALLGGGNAYAELPRFNPLLRLPEFVIGICAATWQLRTKHRIPTYTASVAIVASLASVPFLRYFPPVLASNGLLAPLFAIMIIGLGNSKGPLELCMSSPVLVALGRASYSLYLLHIPLLFWFNFFLNSNPGGRLAGAPFFHRDAPFALVAYSSIAVVASLVGYRLIEVPGRRLIQEQARRTRDNHDVSRAA